MIEALVINYNTGQMVLSCIKSLVEFGLPYLIIDNNSQDGSFEKIKKTFPKSRIIRNNSNIGFARAVNQGVKNITSSYILLINPDAVLKKGVDAIVEFLDNNPKAAVIGGLVLNPDRTRQPSCRGIPTLLNFPFGRTSTLTRIFPQNPLSASMILSDIDYLKPGKAPAVAGTFMFLRKSSFEAVGGMDENFFLYVEDVDLCKRMWDNGYEVWFHPGSECIHHFGESYRDSFIKSRIHHLRSMVYFLQKHYQPGPLISNLLNLGAGLSAIYFLSWFQIRRKRKWR